MERLNLEVPDVSAHFLRSTGTPPTPLSDPPRLHDRSEGKLIPVDRLREKDSVTDVVKTSFELIATSNRAVSRYERNIRELEAAAAERPDHSADKVKWLKNQLAEALRSNRKLSEQVAKLKHSRGGLVAERDELRVKLGNSESSRDELNVALESEMKWLRVRREDYCLYMKLSAYRHLVGRAQRLLSKHKSYADPFEGSRPKFLEYNQAVGNKHILEALVADGQISLLVDGVIERVDNVAAQLKEELNRSSFPISLLLTLTCPRVLLLPFQRWNGSGRRASRKFVMSSRTGHPAMRRRGRPRRRGVP
ncbi:PREDICTED: uncharacterized protein LOC104759765 [Camelina sativa]|uniref:Uncharacterized protein LOC104759765 n=1 Tax=Camelina sativa TaxID=90675 RepID=A0ABM0X5C2_CAMSA|nr:PREDICTED: uncharacterized protein LOC104759765 [Camelina sativa]